MTDTNTEVHSLIKGRKDDRYSLERVRAIDTVEAAEEYISLVAKDVVADDNVAAKRTGEATIKAALATFVAVTLGVISEEQRGQAVMTKGEYASKFGRAQSLVSRWIALGYALMRCEIDPTGEYEMNGQPFPLWMVLSSKGGADKKEVTPLLRDGADADEVIAALSKFYTPDGKPIRQGNPGGAGTPRLTASSSKDDGTAVVTDDKGEETTLDVSKNAVRLALELREVWDKAGGVNGEGINRADMSVIRKVLAPLMVTPEEAAAAQPEADAS
jgi:hypothetical protein